MLLVLSVLSVAGCGDADGDGGSTGGGEASVAAQGAYVGDLAVQTDVPTDAIFTTAEITIAADGSMSGTITTKAPTATVDEEGTVSGVLSATDQTSYEADLVLDLPSLGSFTAAGTLVYGESTGQLAGQLSARDEQGELVGSTVIAVHRE